MNAYIVHTKRGFKIDWHGYAVPVLWLDDKPRFTSEDILVISEGMMPIARQCRGLGYKCVFLPLNWAYIYACFAPDEDFRSYNVVGVLTPSFAIKRFVQWSMGLESTVIEEFIDTARYRYSPDKKRNKIAYMARKSKAGDVLARICRRKPRSFAGYEWVRMTDLPEEHYAAELAAARIYIPTGAHEGANVSVLEAMSAGCIVIGFSGVGGRDFMLGEGEHQNCVLIENEDLGALGAALEDVIRALAENPESFNRLINNAVATAARYGDFETEGRQLKRYFESL